MRGLMYADTRRGTADLLSMKSKSKSLQAKDRLFEMKFISQAQQVICFRENKR